jgi:hypothetical protein
VKTTSKAPKLLATRARHTSYSLLEEAEKCEGRDSRRAFFVIAPWASRTAQKLC